MKQGVAKVGEKAFEEERAEKGWMAWEKAGQKWGFERIRKHKLLKGYSLLFDKAECNTSRFNKRPGSGSTKEVRQKSVQ